jgi:hypothetical protein
LGLSQKFIKDGIHCAQKNIGYFVGNVLFASENAINKRNMSRKHDLESLMYLVAYIYSGLSLPWVENIPEQYSNILKYVA